MPLTGAIRRWNLQKGYGFIKGDDGADVFVHRSDINGDPEEVAEIEEGTLVQYEVQPHDGRLKAMDVTVKAGGAIGVGGLRTGGARTPGATKRVVPPGKTVGRVKLWFDSGYGFVVPSSGEHQGKDIYVHHSSFGGGALNIGWELYFDIQTDPTNPGKLRAAKASGPAVCGRGCRAQAPHEGFHSGAVAKRVPPISIIKETEEVVDEEEEIVSKPIVVGEMAPVTDSFKPY